MRKTNIICLGSLSSAKTKEFKALFKNYPEIDFKSLTEMAWNPSSFADAENGNTYYDNAFKKCKLAHMASKVPTISDDSGLEVEALSKKLGVFSKRYAIPKDGESQDQANNKKLLEELKGLPHEKRRARFVCTIVFMVEGVVLHTTGVLDGHIAEAPRGDNGFGYDPLFIPTGFDKTFAEFTTENKNRISHRAKALKALMSLIEEKKIELVRP